MVEMSCGESGPSIKPSALLQLAPVVGARMELQREMVRVFVVEGRDVVVFLHAQTRIQ